MGKILESALGFLESKMRERTKDKKGEKPSKKAVEPTITVEVLHNFTQGRPSWMESDIDYKDHMRRLEKAELTKRDIMRGKGIDIDSFTEEKAARDSMEMIARFVPDLLDIPIDDDTARVSVQFQNLTKTGKVPKNVAHASLDYKTTKKPEIWVISNLKYLADGSVNMTDLYIWCASLCLSVDIRRVGDDHAITYLTTLDNDCDLRRVIYDSNSSKEIPEKTASSALKKMIAQAKSGGRKR